MTHLPVDPSTHNALGLVYAALPIDTHGPPRRKAQPGVVVALALALLLSMLAGPFIAHVRAAPSEPAIQRVTLFNMPVTSGANVLTSSLTVGTSHPASAYRLTVMIKPGATDAKAQPVVTAGGVSFAGALNGDTVLTAGVYYTFTYGVALQTTTATPQALAWNMQFSASTTLAYFDLQEVRVP